MSKNLNEQQPGSPKEFILLFRGKDWDEGVPVERLQEVMDRFMAWSQQLGSTGRIRAGQALDRTGAIVSGRGVDGPFIESKEAIGGYCILQADTLAEAIAIAKTAPFLDFEGSIEIRPMVDECPVFKRIRERHGLVPASRDLVAA